MESTEKGTRMNNESGKDTGHKINVQNEFYLYITKNQ